MKTIYFSLGILLISLFILVGCAPPSATSTSTTVSPTQRTGDSYPAPTQIQSSSYPAPVQEENQNTEPFINAPSTFDAETGGFEITLFYPGGDRPVRGQTFYAAELLPVTGQLEGSFVPAVDTNSAPRGGSDDNGLVVFSNVPPGNYALVIMTPLGPILVIDNQTEENIEFEILPNQLTEFPSQEVFLNPDVMEP